MPFDKSFDDVYRLGIQAAGAAAGVDAKRLDDSFFDKNMLEQIYGEIDRADLIIADMSTRNVNVFYEAGYADAKKKLIIFLTSDDKDIPFDLKHRPHIVYGNSLVYLKTELTKKLQWAVDEVKKRAIQPLRLTLKVRQTEFVRTEYRDTGKVDFRIEIHNISDHVVGGIDAFYLFTSKMWSISQNGTRCASSLVTAEAGLSTMTRHIISPAFTSVPPHDSRPVDITGEKMLWASWQGKDRARPDLHVAQGILKLELHTPEHQVRHEEKLEAKFDYDAIPF